MRNILPFLILFFVPVLVLGIVKALLPWVVGGVLVYILILINQGISICEKKEIGKIRNKGEKFLGTELVRPPPNVVPFQ